MTSQTRIDTSRARAGATFIYLGGAALALLALTAPLSAQDPAPQSTAPDSSAQQQTAQPTAQPASQTGDPAMHPLVNPKPNVAWEPGQKGKIVGAILARNGDDMLVREQNSDRISVVTITGGTQIESPSGVLNLARKSQDANKLMPGLFIKARGNGGDRGNFVAERISFHKTALKVANQIEAGEVDLEMRQNAAEANQAATAAQVQKNLDAINAATARARDSLAALNARITNLDSYDARFSGEVMFATGSAKLTSAAKRTLDSLVDQIGSMQGYMVEVAGHADARGTAAYNQHLSERRVSAVVTYLAATKQIPIRRIVNPTGLGESTPQASNGNSEGQAANRRVEVRVLVNRGINPQ